MDGPFFGRCLLLFHGSVRVIANQAPRQSRTWPLRGLHGSSPRVCPQASTRPHLGVCGFFLRLHSPRQSLETSLQAALESFMQTPVVVHEKNLFLQRFRGALEKRILFAYSKTGAVSREGRWTLFAQGLNVLREQTRLSRKSRPTLPLGLKTVLRIKCLTHSVNLQIYV